MKRLTMPLMTFVLTPLMALATTWYVDGTNGSDANTGWSQTTAKKTIQSAIDASYDGDMILVAAGTYASIVTSNKAISISSLNGPITTIIDGGGTNTCALLCERSTDHSYWIECSKTILDGFTLQNGYAKEKSAAAHYGTIRHCIIRYCHAGGYSGASGCTGSVVSDTLAYENTYDSSWGGGVFNNCYAINCTVVNNVGVGLWDGEIRNTISWGNRFGGKETDTYVSSGCKGRIHNCLTQSEIIDGTGNIGGEPRFVDTAANDYRLADGSIGINAGSNLYVTNTVDLAGNTRIVNGTVDIGCYEFGSSSSLTNGLVAWYKFDGDADDSMVNDRGLNLESGTVSYFQGAVGQAVYFDGASVLSRRGTQRFDVECNFTISCWVKPDSDIKIPKEGTSGIVTGGNCVFGPAQCVTYGNEVGTGIGFAVGKNGVVVYEHGNYYLPAVLVYEHEIGMNWTFISVRVQDDGAPELYINGSYIRTAKKADRTHRCASVESIGEGAYGYSKCYLDDLRIYNRALSATEVSALYNEIDNPIVCHSVTFDANGGTRAIESTNVVDGVAVGELPTVTRNGYDFLGWFTAAVGGELVLTETVVTNDFTLYAQWKAVEYDISYTGLRGASNPNPTSYTIEDAITFVDPGYAAGYRFAGWSPSAIAKGSTGDKVVTANWQTIPYSITYIDTKGAANPNPATYTIEDAVTFAALPDVEGWKFIGWSLPGIAKGNVGIVTVSALWEKKNPDVGDDDGDDEPNQLYCGVILRSRDKTSPNYGIDRTGFPTVTNVCSYPEVTSACTRDQDATKNYLEHRTWVYWGKMYLTAGKYRFAARFDDDVYVKVDGAVILDANTTVSVAVRNVDIENTGWHDVEFRFHNRGEVYGDYAAHADGYEHTWPCGKSFGYRNITDDPTYASQNGADYVIPGLDTNGNEIGGVFKLPGNTVASIVNRMVTFDANGGTCAIESTNVVDGVAVGELPTVTHNGYDFLGWFTAAVGGELALTETVVTNDFTLHAQWKAVEYDISYTGLRGASNPNPTSYTIEDAITFVDPGEVAGYRFAGWSPSAIAKGSTGDKVVTANWQTIPYSITYIDTKGAANPNPATYTIEDAVTFAALPDVEGWKFVGWSLSGFAKGTVGVVTVSAIWEKKTPDVGGGDGGDDSEPMDASVANTYDGVIVDADGLPLGYINVKAMKASGKGDAAISKVTATIQMVGEAKRVTVKGNVSVAAATMMQAAPDGRLLDLTFSRNGIWGTFDGYEIDGSRNLLASTAKSDKGSAAKIAAENVYAALKGNYVMAYEDESGWNGLSVSVMTKGKVKVSGKLANGTSVATTTQLIVGSDYSCIPVIYTKETTSLAFSIYFENATQEASVFGYYDAVVSPVSGLNVGLYFGIEGDVDALFVEYSVLGEFLPDGVLVEQSGNKWVVAGGAKAGQIKMVDGSPVDKKESENPSGLKLTFTAKTGAFKGSFKVYALDATGKLKSFTANVTGIVVNGQGYGTATVKGKGTFAVIIAP